jgi:hypothetical protein
MEPLRSQASWFETRSFAALLTMRGETIHALNCHRPYT